MCGRYSAFTFLDSGLRRNDGLQTTAHHQF